MLLSLTSDFLISCGKHSVLDMWICISFFFCSLARFFGMLYRRDRALEVAAEVVDVPDDGSNGPAVLDEEAPLEDGNVDEVSGAGDVVPIAKPSRNKGGAKRRDWEHFATERIDADENLRSAARRWLQQKEILVKPFTTSSNKSKTCLLARCAECEKCSLEYCFSLQSKEELLVERFGDCSGKKD